MGRLSPEGERQEAEAYAELAKKPKVHMKDDDCPKLPGSTHLGLSKCMRCGVVFGTERKITYDDLTSRFGDSIPHEVIKFLFGGEAESMTVAEARAEIDKRWPKPTKLEPPKVAEHFDWSPVIKLASEERQARISGEYHDDSDMPQYIYEAVMEAVYPGYFSWTRQLR